MKTLLIRCACAALLASAAAPAAELYHVAGVVLNSETGAPLARANVGMRPDNGSIVIAKQVTGSDGRFSFELPKGSYHLTAGTRDALEEYGHRTPQSRIGTAVMVGPGLNTSNLVFRWHAPASIIGRITDETGEPVESAIIQCLVSRVEAGRRVTTFMAWAHSNDRGEYRFWNLSGGSYYLAVTAEPWYGARVRFGKPDAIASTSYAPVYYPNAPDVAGAALLMLKPGEEARADFSLRTVPGATVSVSYEGDRVTNGLVSLIREGIGGTDGYQRQVRTAGQVQVLNGIPPGRYLLRVNGAGGKGSVVGRQWVDVNGVDLEVKVKLQPAPSVSGTLQWNNPQSRPKGSVLAVVFAQEPRYNGSTVSVRPDGGFTFPALTEGRYRPAVRIGSFYPAMDIHVEGADFRDGVMTVAEGDTAIIRIVAEGDNGAVKGFVMNGEQPLESVMVALAPTQDSTNYLVYRGYQSDSDGSFDFANVPLGEYFLFAVDDPDLEYTNPAALRAYYPNAKRIRVEAGKTVAGNLVLLEKINPRGSPAAPPR